MTQLKKSESMLCLMAEVESADKTMENKLFYSDKKTLDSESNEDWLGSAEYCFDKWKSQTENISVFLKTAVTAWYALTLDGVDLSLTKSECERLGLILCDTYSYFTANLTNDVNCQWLFGYMMTVRPDLFLDSGEKYSRLECEGERLIEQASESGNVFARLLSAVNHGRKKEIKQCREAVRACIFDFFDPTREVDSYFIEVLT